MMPLPPTAGEKTPPILRPHVTAWTLRYSLVIQPVARKPPPPPAAPAATYPQCITCGSVFLPERMVCVSRLSPWAARPYPVGVVAGRPSPWWQVVSHRPRLGAKKQGGATASRVARNREKIPDLHIVSTTPAVGGNGAWCYLT